MAPIDESPAFSQNLKTPSNLKQVITVDLPYYMNRAALLPLCHSVKMPVSFSGKENQTLNYAYL